MTSGMVTALERSNVIRRGATLWKCECACGRIYYTEAYKISQGKIQSCGCLRNAHKFRELTGQRYGKLVALQRLEEKRNSSFLWLCRCDCGTECKVPIGMLTGGKIASCGCDRTERQKRQSRDISGQKFGRLIAVHSLEERKWNQVVWHCVCDCGQTTDVPLSSLVSGNTKSCGCLTHEKSGPKQYMHYVDGTCIEALCSKKLRKDNTSGFTGVQYEKRSDKWVAQITFKGETVNLGKYTTKEEAASARKRAEDRIFTPFLNMHYESTGEK